MNEKIIDLGICPRCESNLNGMMTAIKFGVKWCYLCAHDIGENDTERENWKRWAENWRKDHTNELCRR